MNNLIITNGTIVSDNQQFRASILVENGVITEISENIDLNQYPDFEILDVSNKFVIPGIIDTHVHFREPGLTAKAEIATESRAAAAGGVTTFFDMPNTVPQTTTIELLEKKFDLAKEKSLINYSFFIGAANDNENELKKIDKNKIAGIKLFYASSTGNMLVDKSEAIENIFKNSEVPVVIHSEEQPIIAKNFEEIKNKVGKILPKHHEQIRSVESCKVATEKLINLAKKYNTKIHLLHITTADEVELFSDKNISEKNITSEVSPNHLYFDSGDYEKYNFLIKCNPAIKAEKHKIGLLQGLKNGKIDTVATDHAPHVYADKFNEYEKAPSGIPSIQHSLNIMLDFVKKGELSLEQVVEKMCHNPAKIFNIAKRGYLQKGYWADIAIVDMNTELAIKKENLYYKCAWSPLENTTFGAKVWATVVNGKIVFRNDEFFDEKVAMRIEFER